MVSAEAGSPVLLVGLFLVFNQPWPSSWCWAAANPLWSSPILPREGQAPSWVWGTPDSPSIRPTQLCFSGWGWGIPLCSEQLCEQVGWPGLHRNLLSAGGARSWAVPRVLRAQRGKAGAGLPQGAWVGGEPQFCSFWGERSCCFCSSAPSAATQGLGWGCGASVSLCWCAGCW